jgi:outer membrane immunogenic protein
MLRHLLSGAVIIAASVSPVLAADLIIEEEDVFVPEVVADDWSGVYIGGHVGWGWGNVDVTDEGGAPFPLGPIEPYDASGFLVGGQIGANLQMDSFVVGVVGDLAWTGITGDSLLSGDDMLTTDVNWLGTVRGKLGFAADVFMIYGTAGVAFAGVDTTLTDTGVDATTSATDVGWVAGIGAEAMVAENVSIFGEVLYHDFGSNAVTFTGESETATTSLNVTTVKVGANFHF